MAKDIVTFYYLRSFNILMIGLCVGLAIATKEIFSWLLVALLVLVNIPMHVDFIKKLEEKE